MWVFSCALFIVQVGSGSILWPTRAKRKRSSVFFPFLLQSCAYVCKQPPWFTCWTCVSLVYCYRYHLLQVFSICAAIDNRVSTLASIYNQQMRHGWQLLSSTHASRCNNVSSCIALLRTHHPPVHTHRHAPPFNPSLDPGDTARLTEDSEQTNEAMAPLDWLTSN